MVEVWRKTLARRGEAFNGIEGALSEGQSLSEVGVGGQGRGKPIPQPSDLYFGGVYRSSSLMPVVEGASVPGVYPSG